MVQMIWGKWKKKESERIAYALILGIVVLFFFYQELSWIEDEEINVEIENMMVCIERYKDIS